MAPDPLSSTFWLLPLVLASFWLQDRWLRKRAEGKMPPWGRRLDGVALMILVLLVAGRNHLGLGAGSGAVTPVLMAGFVLWITARVALNVHGLAAVARVDVEGRPPWPFFILPLTLYLALAPWMVGQRGLDGDEPYFLLIAHSLAFDFDSELTNNYAAQDSLRFGQRVLEPEWADPVRPDGRLYSRHSPVLPLLLAPGYRLAGKWGALSTMMLVTAGVTWSLLSLAWLRLAGSERSTAVWPWALLALTPPVLLYSHQLWTEMPAALLVLTALHQIDGLGRRDRTWRRRWLLLLGALILLPLLKLRFAILSISLLVLAGLRGGRSKRLLLGVSLIILATVGGILAYNQLVFDNPFKDHTLDQLLQIQIRSPIEYLRGVAGLFWDGAFGLFACNPLWLLLLPGLVVAVRRRMAFLRDLLILALPYLALVSPRLEWYGAWSPPFRFGMVLLPLFALALVPLAGSWSRSGARSLLFGLGFVALALTTLWVVVPGWTYNLATGTNHLVDHLASRWAADVGRFVPSMVRPQPATLWVPLVTSAIVLLLWWRPQGRPTAVSCWPLVVTILGWALLPVAASRWPTHTVEFEDRQVVKEGGELFPEPWIPVRPRFRGGWSLAAGTVVRAPVIAGGESCEIELDYQWQGSGRESTDLVMLAGSSEVARMRVEESRGWRTAGFADVRWPVGQPLILRLESAAEASGVSSVVVDRARFTWQ